ncbi:hypothetical protein JCM11251_003771 [Rhodosporidiobolus azoricus]
MAPKIVLHTDLPSLPLIAALPGHVLSSFSSLHLDLAAFPDIKGPVVSGFFRNLGTEPEFDIVYPDHEFKYIVEGELAVIEDGKKITACPGDAIYFPAGSSFRILPTKFTSFL